MSWFTALPFPQRQAFALSALVTMASGPLHAQVAPAPAPASANEQDLPVTVQAEEIGGRPDREINLDRNVELTRGQTRLVADTACYRLVEDEVSASGHIKLWRFGDRYQGDALQLNMSTGRGWVLNPTYRLQLNNAQGGADRIDFLGEDQALVVDGTYSTCEGTQPDWYLKSSTLRLDTGRDVGTAGKTVIYFKGVPILATPAMSFSLSGARRSGWLPPSLEFGSEAEIMVPYYFNIAPNRDLTVSPRMIFDRGLQLGATARYIGQTEGGTYGGETHVEALPNDRITKTDRWLVKSFHSQALSPNWSYGWNLHGASDDEYPSDFSRTVAASAERQLMRDVYTSYVTPDWSLSVRAQNVQVLQEPAAVANPALAIPRPYDRLPQVTFHTGRYDVKGFDWAIDADATRFSHPTFDSGNRLVTVSQVSYPFIRPGYYVTPKLMLHATKYDMDRKPRTDGSAPLPDSLSRTLPIFSIDSGMVFERDASLFGKAATQTLEPRLFYVRTPYKDQDKFPLFDTTETGFSYAQLFSENRFVGADRISDANQLTAALTSRFIEPDGAERLRMLIAQRFYLNEPRVGRKPTGQGKSDLLLAASGRIIDNWNFDSSVQYDATDRSVFAQSHGVRWAPAPMKVLNAEYRYVRDSFRNADLSAQWPLSKRWYGVGRVSYSLRDHKVLESLMGLEYKADCWIFRMGGQRFVTAAQATATRSFFQLELNGLSRFGPGNALDAFYRNVPGYTRLNGGGRP